MFEAALREYAALVRGNPAYVGILFHALTGIFFGGILFIIFNVNGVESLTLMGHNINYNENYFLFIPVKFLNLEKSTDRLKIIEFMVCILISILITILIAKIRRRRSLDDALSSIRNNLIGFWKIKLIDFARSKDGERDLSFEAKFGETEARKLRIDFDDSSELAFSGDTALVALYVGEGADKPEFIEIAFPLEAEAHKSGTAENILYWIRLKYIAFSGVKSFEFTGTWYHVRNLGDEFRHSGRAEMTFVRKLG